MITSKHKEKMLKDFEELKEMAHQVDCDSSVPLSIVRFIKRAVENHKNVIDTFFPERLLK